ncbi:hypothetical protein D4764_14G0000090 [Takifugu flavidus]|uniref:Uncharacterized protein n=1 Tax=Takifugu flavidus TaxID=433684 RepID=A0A5C6P5A2_9TELE|nr:hypothetical protein D4764_14G0000090 [Takifugu flavidus]
MSGPLQTGSRYRRGSRYEPPATDGAPAVSGPLQTGLPLEIKEFMQSRGEDAALLEDTGWTLDLAFLTDITGKRNSLNWELQGKEQKVLHFPSVQMVLRDNASACEALD